jgi:hypothetical protein
MTICARVCLHSADDRLSSRNRQNLAGGVAMKNGLYSIHIWMLDGVKGRASGVIFLSDGGAA